MSVTNFITNDNMDLLWEIILDDDSLTHIKSTNKIENVRETFISRVKSFYDNERKTNSIKGLVDMNKSFLLMFTNNLNTNTTVVKPIITAEDVQKDKRSLFEKELTLKQNEFNNAMSKSIPETPNFHDKKDEPIGEMEELIAQMLKQRNFELEQIQQTVSKQGNVDVSKWLNGTETSIKSEKGPIVQIPSKIGQGQGSGTGPSQGPIKYIKIGEEIDNIIIGNNNNNNNYTNNFDSGSGSGSGSGSMNLKKHISWSTDLDIQQRTPITEPTNINMTISEKPTNDKINDNKNNIFLKLKSFEPIESNKSNKSNKSIETGADIEFVKSNIVQLHDKMDAISSKLDNLFTLLTHRPNEHNYFDNDAA